VIQPSTTISSQSSSLSANLQRLSVDIAINVLDVHSQVLLKRYVQSSESAAFDRARGEEKAIESALNRIKPELVNLLHQSDQAKRKP